MSGFIHSDVSRRSAGQSGDRQLRSVGEQQAQRQEEQGGKREGLDHFNSAWSEPGATRRAVWLQYVVAVWLFAAASQCRCTQGSNAPPSLNES
jgi:hypothetical protein